MSSKLILTIIWWKIECSNPYSRIIKSVSEISSLSLTGSFTKFGDLFLIDMVWCRLSLDLKSNWWKDWNPLLVFPPSNLNLMIHWANDWKKISHSSPSLSLNLNLMRNLYYYKKGTTQFGANTIWSLLTLFMSKIPLHVFKTTQP